MPVKNRPSVSAVLSGHSIPFVSMAAFFCRHPGAPAQPSATHRGPPAARPPPLRALAARACHAPSPREADAYGTGQAPAGSCARLGSAPRPVRGEVDHTAPPRLRRVLRRGSRQPAARSATRAARIRGCAVAAPDARRTRARAAGRFLAAAQAPACASPVPAESPPSRLGTRHALAARRTALRQAGCCPSRAARYRQCRHPSPAAGHTGAQAPPGGSRPPSRKAGRVRAAMTRPTATSAAASGLAHGPRPARRSRRPWVGASGPRQGGARPRLASADRKRTACALHAVPPVARRPAAGLSGAGACAAPAARHRATGARPAAPAPVAARRRQPVRTRPASRRYGAAAAAAAPAGATR